MVRVHCDYGCTRSCPRGLIQHLSWRWIFFINLPLALVVLAITIWRVPESRARRATDRLDWGGVALATAGLGALVFGLIESVPLAAVAGIVLLIGFLWLESRSAAPMLPLALFRSRSFTGANLLTFLVYAALSGVLFFFPMNLIQVQGYSPTEAGAALLPFIVLMFLMSRCQRAGKKNAGAMSMPSPRSIATISFRKSTT